MHVDNVRITGNTINHLTTNDIVIQPTGNGLLNINNIYIEDNTITNNLDTVISINNTLNGYTKFSGARGIRIPSGNTIGPEGAVTGMIRYDVDAGYVAVFDGTAWRSPTSASNVLNADEVADVMDIWTIILG
jgi:hypothetical protein